MGVDEIVHHLNDGIDIQLASGMGIQHGSLIDCLTISCSGSFSLGRMRIVPGEAGNKGGEKTVSGILLKFV